MKNLCLLTFILLVTFSSQSFSQYQATPQNGKSVFGVWETARVPEEGEDTIAHIKIYPCQYDSRKACGKIVWSERDIDPETGQPPLDKENSDESLRNRPIMCMEIMTGFTPTDEPNHYDDGEIYSSRTGKTYSGEITLINENHLKLRGSVLFGLIGRESTWKRVTNPHKDPCK